MNIGQKFLLIIILANTILYSCGEDDSVDSEKPRLSIDFNEAFPSKCNDTIYFGEAFTLKVQLKDNDALAKYSVDIHNNFDQHSHSTETVECDFDLKKKATNAIHYEQVFELPSPSQTYTTEAVITLDPSNNIGAYQSGDHHLEVTVIDQTGWSNILSIGVKVLHRNK